MAPVVILYSRRWVKLTIDFEQSFYKYLRVANYFTRRHVCYLMMEALRPNHQYIGQTPLNASITTTMHFSFACGACEHYYQYVIAFRRGQMT